MTNASAAASQPSRRRLGRVGAIVLALAVLGCGSIVVLAVEPDDGPASQIVGFAERVLGQNDDLHYNIHRSLGKLFSFCPCTLTLSRSQYEKAFYHRPRPSPQP